MFSFALCMYPDPLLVSAAKFVAFAGMDSSYIRDKRMYRGFLPPPSGPASSQILMWAT